MIEQQGLVTRSQPGQTWVRLGAESGCSACDAGEGCGAGVFGKLLQRKPIEIAIPGERSVSVGSSVMVGIAESQFLSWVFGLFALPLLAGIAGASVCHYISQYVSSSTMVGDLAALIGGLVSGGLVLKRVAGWLMARVTGMELVLLNSNETDLSCQSVHRN